MSLILKIKKQRTITKSFLNNIEFKSKHYKDTYFEEYLFSVSDIHLKDQTDILSHVNKLPLFWTNNNQTQLNIFKENYNLNLSSLDFTKKGFGLINPDELKNLAANYLFCLEFSLFKFLEKINLTNVFQGHFKTPHFVQSAVLMNASSIDLEMKNSLIKLKVGIHDLEFEKNVIAKLARNNTLRLDANQMLSKPSLEYLLEDISSDSIDYIEEPFQDIFDWQTFSYKDKFQLAVDESNNLNLETLYPYIKCFVVKPTYNFSISQVFEHYLSRNNKQLIISSSYEEEESYNFLIHLAALIDPERKNQHGLGTYKIMNQEKFLKSNSSDRAIILQSFPLS